MPKKILIVDDSPTSRLMHRHLITSKTNYEVLCATDGLQALDLAKSAGPDLILMDVMMPKVDGWKSAGVSAKTPRRSPCR